MTSRSGKSIALLASIAALFLSGCGGGDARFAYKGCETHGGVESIDTHGLFGSYGDWAVCKDKTVVDR